MNFDNIEKRRVETIIVKLYGDYGWRVMCFRNGCVQRSLENERKSCAITIHTDYCRPYVHTHMCARVLRKRKRLNERAFGLFNTVHGVSLPKNVRQETRKIY